jgi:predicted flap endonuclease-1-like 5' DNA nuclease
MYVIIQNLVFLLMAFALGMLIAWLLGLCNCRDGGEIETVRKERDDLAARLAAAGSAPPAPLVARDDARVSGLESELAEARVTADRQAGELARLRAELDATRVDDEATAAMKWRNRYLEARVKFLEEAGAPAAAAAPLAAGLAGAGVAAAVAAPRKAKAKTEDSPLIDNANFVASPLANLTSDELERQVLAAGEGRAPTPTRRRTKPDDLLLIDGVGPINLAWLNEKGIRYFWQIATMDAEQLAWLARNLPRFGTRVYRENWVRQCVNLAAGRGPRQDA